MTPLPTTAETATAMMTSCARVTAQGRATQSVGLPRVAAKAAPHGTALKPLHGGAALERLLGALCDTGGFDLTDYSRPCLTRRVAERMGRLGIGDMDAYTDFLRRDPAEGTALCRTVWINVTDFFRDPPVWERLRTQVIPELLARQGDASPLRIWSAGCASGQEVYSLAMLLAEALDPSGSDWDTLASRVEIVATDVDEEALAQARQGVYSERALAAVPSSLREKYFEPAAGGGRVCDALRRMVRFQRHNLLARRLPGAYALIVCRNTLIYFRPESQGQVLIRLRHAIAADGYLLLGQAEMPLFQDRDRMLVNCFASTDRRTRLYQKALA